MKHEEILGLLEKVGYYIDDSPIRDCPGLSVFSNKWNMIGSNGFSIPLAGYSPGNVSYHFSISLCGDPLVLEQVIPNQVKFAEFLAKNNFLFFFTSDWAERSSRGRDIRAQNNLRLVLEARSKLVRFCGGTNYV